MASILYISEEEGVPKISFKGISLAQKNEVDTAVTINCEENHKETKLIVENFYGAVISNWKMRVIKWLIKNHWFLPS